MKYRDIQITDFFHEVWRAKHKILFISLIVSVLFSGYRFFKDNQIDEKQIRSLSDNEKEDVEMLYHARYSYQNLYKNLILEISNSPLSNSSEQPVIKTVLYSFKGVGNEAQVLVDRLKDSTAYKSLGDLLDTEYVYLDNYLKIDISDAQSEGRMTISVTIFANNEEQVNQTVQIIDEFFSQSENKELISKNGEFLTDDDSPLSNRLLSYSSSFNSVASLVNTFDAKYKTLTGPEKEYYNQLEKSAVSNEETAVIDNKSAHFIGLFIISFVVSVVVCISVLLVWYICRDTVNTEHDLNTLGLSVIGKYEKNNEQSYSTLAHDINQIIKKRKQKSICYVEMTEKSEFDSPVKKMISVIQSINGNLNQAFIDDIKKPESRNTLGQSDGAIIFGYS